MVKGKMIVRDFPAVSLSNALAMVPAYTMTADVWRDVVSSYDRPTIVDVLLSNDLIDAAKGGATGLIFAFDVPREQVQDYWDPHQGIHYSIPAVFVGVDEREQVLEAASRQSRAEITVLAEVEESTTRNIIATLPGQSSETIVYASHTDGTTCVQENGPIALLGLAQYFSRLPLSERRRTLQFAFNSSHLHVSREGCGLHAQILDSMYQRGESDVVLVIPVEHLGAREVEAFKRPDGRPGRELRFTGRGELMIWCVGPSPVVVRAVCQSVRQRKLDRVLVTRGVNQPNLRQVPTFTNFGGLGTLYHNFLLPTTSLISGPWTLWAPSFGTSAVDAERMRAQTLALGDIYCALDDVDKVEVVGGYAAYRSRRGSGFPAPGFLFPSEDEGLFDTEGGKVKIEEYMDSVQKACAEKSLE
jgi:hypothetical protein